MGESAEVVSTHVIKNIILQFGLLQTQQSDNGLAIISKVIQIFSSTLGVTWNLHIPYHPQSLGKVERMNGIIKVHLKKTVHQAPFTLEPALATGTDSDLTQIRATPQSPSFLSPFEIMYGQPFLFSNLPLTDPDPLADYLPYLNLLRQLIREHADQILP
jgi:hypothetical protein